MEVKIGDWVRRGLKGPYKWHLVDSIVADRVVTRCGKQMKFGAWHSLHISQEMPLTRAIGQPQLCKAGCDSSAAGGL